MFLCSTNVFSTFSLATINQICCVNCPARNPNIRLSDEEMTAGGDEHRLRGGGGDRGSEAAVRYLGQHRQRGQQNGQHRPAQPHAGLPHCTALYPAALYWHRWPRTSTKSSRVVLTNSSVVGVWRWRVKGRWRPTSWRVAVLPPPCVLRTLWRARP